MGTYSLFKGALGASDNSAATCGGFGTCFTSKQDNFIGYVYIRHTDASHSFPTEGNYEIVRVGSSSQMTGTYDSAVDLIIYAPGVPDIYDSTTETDGVAFPTGARLY